MESNRPWEKRPKILEHFAVLELTLCHSSKAGIGKRDVKCSSDRAVYMFMAKFSEVDAAGCEKMPRYWLDFCSGLWKLALWVGERWERISSRIFKMNMRGLPSDPKEG